MKKFDNALKILDWLLLVVLALTFVGSLYMNDKAALAGNQLTVIESKIDDQEKYNYHLSSELNMQNSTAALYKRIEDAQFVRAKVDYMELPTLALR